jgi:hypothetical protein
MFGFWAMIQQSSSSIDLPLPKDWQASVRGAFVGAVGLAHSAITFARSWAVNSRLSRVRLTAECDRLRTEVALLNRERDLLRARFEPVPPRNRPHFSPPERLAVLELKAARAWNASQTARRLLLAPGTLSAWFKRLNERGERSLVEVPVPVNRFPDFVGRLVQDLSGLLTCWLARDCTSVLRRSSACGTHRPSLPTRRRRLRMTAALRLPVRSLVKRSKLENHSPPLRALRTTLGTSI